MFARFQNPTKLKACIPSNYYESEIKYGFKIIFKSRRVLRIKVSGCILKWYFQKTKVQDS